MLGRTEIIYVVSKFGMQLADYCTKGSLCPFPVSEQISAAAEGDFDAEGSVDIEQEERQQRENGDIEMGMVDRANKHSAEASVRLFVSSANLVFQRFAWTT